MVARGTGEPCSKVHCSCKCVIYLFFIEIELFIKMRRFEQPSIYVFLDCLNIKDFTVFFSRHSLEKKYIPTTELLVVKNIVKDFLVWIFNDMLIPLLKVRIKAGPCWRCLQTLTVFIFRTTFILRKPPIAEKE